MTRLFDYQNPVWRFMGRIADIFFLSLLWAVCSLPIVTMGASTTALYYVTLKMVKDKEGYLLKAFWHSFKDNLKTSTGIWCIMLMAGGILGIGYTGVFGRQGELTVMSFWGLTIIFVIYLFVMTLVFPLSARLYAGAGRLLCMAFVTAVRNFSWVMLMVVITLCILAVGIFVFWPLLLLGAGSVAYLHSIILVHIIFPKYGWNN